MRGREKAQRAEELEASLLEFHSEVMPLKGVEHTENMLAFVAQLIDSIQRVEYVCTIRKRPINAARADPKSQLFDPIKAAVLFSQSHPEEAFWLVFLATHTGRNLRTEWQLASELYGASEKAAWTWHRIIANPRAYADWLGDHHDEFQGKFGNHRKYESLKPGPKGTPAVMMSYIKWVSSYGSHLQMVAQALEQAQGDPRRAFALLYGQMSKVLRFGRTGRFDYLTMLAKVGLAAIEADSTHMDGATGPKQGARLLFDGKIDSDSDARTLERWVGALENHLGVGMQVMEDAMCNWQKSPNRYLPFRG